MQPGIGSTRRTPEAESSFRVLPRHDTRDRFLDALVDSLIERKLVFAREIVHVKQRQRTARDLLRTSVGITVEREQQRRHVDAVLRRDRERDGAGAGDHVRQKIAVDHDAFAARKLAHGAPLDRRECGPCQQRIFALDRKPVRAADANAERSRADAFADELERETPASVRSEVELVACRRHFGGTFRDEFELIVARGRFDVRHVETKRRPVVRGQKARQRRLHHDRIADDHFGRRMADFLLGPGDGHHADAAIESRHVKLHVRLAVLVHRDDARIKHERCLRRRIARQFQRIGVTARADSAARALHAVDKRAIEIAHVACKTPLTEIMVIGRGRLVVGQVENTHIDCGDHDACVAATDTAHRYRNVPARVRADLLGQVQLHVESARSTAHAEPCDTDRAARHAALLHVERTMMEGDDIGARSPIRADAECDAASVRRDLHLLGRVNLVANDHDRRGTLDARRNRHGHGVAFGVFGFVERDFETIRRIGGGLAVPAGIEGVARGRAVRFRRGHLEAIASVRRFRRERDRLVRRSVQRAFGDLAGLAHGFEIPGTGHAIPLVARLDLIDRPLHVAFRGKLAVGIDEHDVEARLFTLADPALELRADADRRRRCRDRNDDAAFDGAAARFLHADRDLRFQRTRRARQFGERDRKIRVSLVVGFREIRKRTADRRERFVGDTEAEAFEAAAALRRTDFDFALEVERGSGRPEQVASVERRLRGLIGGDLGSLCLQVEFDTIRHIIFDEERNLADRCCFEIGISAQAPGAGGCAGQELHVEAAAAGVAGIDDDAAVFRAVRPRQHEGQRHVHRLGFRVTQKRRDVNGFAAAIDAALGEHIGVERSGRDTARDTAIREIERTFGQRQECIVGALAFRDQDGRRKSAGAAHETHVEFREALRVGLDRAEHFIVLREQLEFRVGDRLCVAEVTHENMQAVFRRYRGNPEIGDDEPLRREVRILLAAGGVCRNGGHHIDARAQILDGFVDREGGGDFLVQFGVHVEFALEGERALIFGKLVDLVARQRLAELGVERRRNERALADADDLDVQLFRVDGNDRDTALAGARQHVGAARESGVSLAVADINLEFGGVAEGFAVLRRNAAARGHGVGFAMAQALDADLLFVRGHRRLVDALHRDERREVGLGRERIGELDAGARRGDVGIDRIVEHAEAVRFAQVIVERFELRRFAALQREFQRIERRAPEFAVGINAADDFERFGFLRAVGGAPVRKIGRRRGPIPDDVAVGGALRTDFAERAGIAKPEGCILFGVDRELAEALCMRARVVRGARRVRFLAKIGGRARTACKFSLKLRFQPCRSSGKIGALESLFLRRSGYGNEQ